MRDLNPPQPAWPYRLERQIGVGGGGVIHSAVHLPTHLSVAIKTVHTTSRRASFLLDRELAAMERLRHPNILELYDHGVACATDPLETGLAWLSLELASGGSLEDWTPRAWVDVSSMALHVLEGLAHAHAHGLVHRDLKPANLLICTSDDLRPGLKIADFGLAWARNDDRRGVKKGGTPDFMAPEQVTGKALAFGPWSDLYAFGAMLWLWITGNPPFLHDDLEAQLHAHVHEALPVFRPRFEVPRGLLGLLKELLHKDWRARPGSAAVVAAQLRALDRCEPLPSYPLPITVEVGTLEPSPVALSNAGLSLVGRREPRVVGRRESRDQLWGLVRTVAGERSIALVGVRGVAGSGSHHLGRWLQRRVVECGVAESFWIDATTGLPGFVERALGVMADGVETLGEGADPLDADLFDHRADPGVLRVLKWLVERARRSPVVVHIYASAEQALELLVEGMLQRAGVPLLFVATGEPDSEVWHSIEHHPRFTSLSLGPLHHRDLMDLATFEFGLTPRTGRSLVHEVGGLPGVLRHWIITLAEQGRLVTSREGFSLRGSPGTPPPRDAAARDQFQRSWSNLGPTERLLIGVGAVVGQSVEHAEWHATLSLLGQAPDDGPLRQLWRGGWIRRTRTAWSFRENWVHQEVLDRQPSETLPMLHAAAAKALATLHPTLDRVGRRAEHLLRAGKLPAALKLLHIVLPAAKEENQWQQVERLLTVLQESVDVSTLHPSDQYLHTYYLFETVRLQSSNHALKPLFEPLERLHPQLSGLASERVARALVESYLLAGRLDDAEHLCVTFDDVRRWRVLGMIAMDRNDLDTAHRWLTQAATQAEGELRSGVANALGRLEAQRGNEDASLEWFRACARHVLPRQRAVPSLNLTIGCLKSGRSLEAAEHARESLHWFHTLSLANRIAAAVWIALAAAAANDRQLFQQSVDHALYALQRPERFPRQLLLALVTQAEQTADPEFTSFLDDVRRKLR